MASLQEILILLLVFLLSYSHNKMFSRLLRTTCVLLSKSHHDLRSEFSLKCCQIGTEPVVLCFLRFCTYSASTGQLH